MDEGEESLLEKLDKVAPASLQQFDAFPKLPSTYKARSGGRGFLTVIVSVIAFFLILNDIGEYIWGWPTFSYGIDQKAGDFMDVNVDVIVNMPCAYLSVDLRDAMGDRLLLSKSLSRDGTVFDVSQAAQLQAQARLLDARQAVAQSRKSRGFFDIFRRSRKEFPPTYKFKGANNACRVYGTLTVKKVTANLHITSLGHGYHSYEHVDHKLMNFSHIVNDFSFGPYFPDMTQPLKNTLEVAHRPFVAYQYFLSVVPTTFVAPRSRPLETNQYSVTHYTRQLEGERGTPGIFFKFDLEPLHMTVHQRTTSFIQFIIRVIGVVGGVWVCAGWALKVGSKAVEVVSGADKTAGIVAAESSGVTKRRKWAGGELRSRVTRQGTGWSVDNGSPYGSYHTTPVTGTFSAQSPLPPPTPMSAQSAYSVYSPAPNSSGFPLSANGHGNGNGFGLGLHSPNGNGNGHLVPPTPGSAAGGGYPIPSPYASTFPPSPNPTSPNGGTNGHALLSPGFGPSSPMPAPVGPPPRRTEVPKKDDKKVD